MCGVDEQFRHSTYGVYAVDVGGGWYVQRPWP